MKSKINMRRLLQVIALLVFFLPHCGANGDIGSDVIEVKSDSLNVLVEVRGRKICIDARIRNTYQMDTVQLFLNVFDGIIPADPDSTERIQQNKHNTIIPYYYELNADDGTKYWLMFRENSRTLEKFTQMVYKPNLHKEAYIIIYFQDFNHATDRKDLKIKIWLKDFVRCKL